GRRLGRVLFRLDNEPAAVIRSLERGEHRGEIDRAVARHGEDAVEHGVEKALVGGASAFQHTRPDILAVDMIDSQPMPPCDIGRVNAGKSKCPVSSSRPTLLPVDAIKRSISSAVSTTVPIW